MSLCAYNDYVNAVGSCLTSDMIDSLAAIIEAELRLWNRLAAGCIVVFIDRTGYILILEDNRPISSSKEIQANYLNHTSLHIDNKKNKCQYQPEKNDFSVLCVVMNRHCFETHVQSTARGASRQTNFVYAPG